MEILGYTVVQMIIACSIIGIGYRVLVGIIGRSLNEISYPKILQTIGVGTLTGIVLITPSFDALSAEINPTAQLLVVVNAILAVIGADAALFAFSKAHERRTNHSPDVSIPDEEEFELPPEED